MLSSLFSTERICPAKTPQMQPPRMNSRCHVNRYVCQIKPTSAPQVPPTAVARLPPLTLPEARGLENLRRMDEAQASTGQAVWLLVPTTYQPSKAAVVRSASLVGGGLSNQQRQTITTPHQGRERLGLVDSPSGRVRWAAKLIGRKTPEMQHFAGDGGRTEHRDPHPVIGGLEIGQAGPRVPPGSVVVPREIAEAEGGP